MNHLCRIILSLSFCCAIFSLNAQSDESLIRSKLDILAKGISQSDTSELRGLFKETATLKTTKAEKLSEASLDAWFKNLIRTIAGELKEEFLDYQVLVDGSLASTWVPYNFYLKGEFHHCGVNALQWHKTLDGWKIMSLIDTRHKSCDLEVQNLDSLMNKWHHAASTADEALFFGSLKPNGIYIGTDATELWTAEEMETWAQKYFEKDTAWHFTTIERNWYFPQTKNVAWFDELLDTWMGICRSSGVLEKHNDEWRIRHYHLSITVPNDDIQEFLKIGKKNNE